MTDTHFTIPSITAPLKKAQLLQWPQIKTMVVLYKISCVDYSRSSMKNSMLSDLTLGKKRLNKRFHLAFRVEMCLKTW